MIDALNNDDIINRAGGRFRLTALIQKRWLEILQGARPLVNSVGLSEMETVIEEIVQGKVAIDCEASGLEPPK